MIVASHYVCMCVVIYIGSNTWDLIVQIAQEPCIKLRALPNDTLELDAEKLYQAIQYCHLLLLVV